MLVLSRKPGERIIVGASVLKVLAVRGNKVRIGVESKEVVLRGELVDQARPRAVESGQEGKDLKKTSVLPEVHRDGRDGLPAGEAVEVTREELTQGTTNE